MGNYKATTPKFCTGEHGKQIYRQKQARQKAFLNATTISRQNISEAKSKIQNLQNGIGNPEIDAQIYFWDSYIAKNEKHIEKMRKTYFPKL